MKLAEIDPNKKYLLSIGEISPEEANAAQLQILGKGLTNVTLVYGDLEMSKRERFFGLYCEQCNVWYRKSDGTIVFYPSVEIAAADLKECETSMFSTSPLHKWAVTEFGTEQYIPPDQQPPTTTLCMVEVTRRNNDWEFKQR